MNNTLNGILGQKKTHVLGFNGVVVELELRTSFANHEHASQKYITTYDSMTDGR